MFQHEKGVSLDSRYEGAKSFTPCPQKIGLWAKKRPNLAQNWHFGPNMGIFGPFDLIPNQKTMRTSCRGGFPIMYINYNTSINTANAVYFVNYFRSISIIMSSINAIDHFFSEIPLHQ